MFVRILLRSALVQPRRSITALSAIAVAAGIATAMLTLYGAVQSKLQRQFRSYGANIILTASHGDFLPNDALVRVDQMIGSDAVAAPFAFAAAQTQEGGSIVVAGTDFNRAKRLNPWWAVTAWPSAQGAALIGARVTGVLPDQAFDVIYGGRKLRLDDAAVLHTGGDDDQRVYISLADFTPWTGLQPTTIEIGAPGDSKQLNTLVSRLAAEFPQAEVHPVREIVEAEGRVFGKTRSTLLASVIIIIATSMLCVLATLTASLLERRKDFALMKAMGASELMTDGIFGIEAAALGALGGIIGYGVGLALAELISWRNFQDSISPRLVMLPEILAGCVALTLLAALLPLTLMKQVQPASMLKGE